MVILRNLLRRKTRTLLTILGIAIGVASIIALGTMAEGLQNGYSSMLMGSKADLVLSQPDAIDITFSSIDEKIGDELAAMPEVAEVSGMLQGWSQTEGEPFFFVFGYPVESFILERFRLVEGVSLDSRDLHGLRGRPVLLGSAAAEVLHKAPGDSLRLGSSIFRVVGIYETGQAFEDSGAIMELSDAQALVGKSRQVNLFYIRLKDPNLQGRFTAKVLRLYKELSLSGAEEYANRQTMVEALNAYVWLIGGLAIVLGGIGMMNAQLMAVFERTREIGVLRAVGWSRWRVLNLILGESLFVCSSGGLLGVGMGWLLLYLLSTQTVMLGVMSTQLSAPLLMQAASVVIVLGLLGGLYPAWRASQLAPVEALRYEGGSTGQRARRLPVGGMAVQSLWQRSMRTILTLSVIGLTVGALMMMQGVIVGMQASMNTMVAGVEVMLRQADVVDTSLSTIDERVGTKISALPGVQSADGIIFTAVMMPDAGGFFIVFGYQPGGYAVRRFNIVEGDPLSGNRQVILGRMMSNALEKKVGSMVDLSGSRYRVVGIYESSVSWEEMGGVITLRDAQMLAGRPRAVTMYALKLRDPGEAEAMVERIRAEYPVVQATISSEFAEQMPDFEASEAMLNGISVLAIVVGGVGVLNTMLMAVFERTREIGVLRSMGWRRRAILGMIMQEALLLGLIGGVFGMGAALAMTAGLQAVPLWGTIVEPAWEWQVTVRAMVTAMVLGLVGGMYPAYRATRLQPVEALRYE